MQADAIRWNQRYANGDGMVEPRAEAEWIDSDGADLLAPPQPGSLALDLACGKGAGSLYLAGLGYQVVAADCALEGLKICAAKAAGLRLPVYPVVMDLDQLVLPDRQFSLITVVRYLNRELFPHLVDALLPGGQLFIKTFNINHLNQRPDFNPDFVLQAGELTTMFANVECVRSGEGPSSSFILVRKQHCSGNPASAVATPR